MEEYIRTGIGVIFILLQIWVTYKNYKKEKLSTVTELAYGVYQFIKKENLLGKIVDDERLTKALELLDNMFYQQTGTTLTPELKASAVQSFQAFHAEDKAAQLTADTVAIEAPKKKE